MAEGNGFTTQRRADDVARVPRESWTGVFVGAVVGLSALGVLSIVGVLLVQPEKDNTSLIATILGFLLPTILSLLGAAVREVNRTVDGRMSEMMVLVGRTASAEAAVREKDQTLKLALALPPEAAAALDETTPPPPPGTPPRRPV